MGIVQYTYIHSITIFIIYFEAKDDIIMQPEYQRTKQFIIFPMKMVEIIIFYERYLLKNLFLAQIWPRPGKLRLSIKRSAWYQLTRTGNLSWPRSGPDQESQIKDETRPD